MKSTPWRNATSVGSASILPRRLRATNDLYRNELRAFMNYFQPNVKLVERIRVGSRVRRKYEPAENAVRAARRTTLDPFVLSGAIETKVRAILRIPHRLPKRPDPIKPADVLAPFVPIGSSASQARERPAKILCGAIIRAPVKGFTARSGRSAHCDAVDPSANNKWLRSSLKIARAHAAGHVVCVE